MTMTDKPSPATEFDEAQRLLISIARSLVGTRPKYLVGIAVGSMLPSSCSSSHPEIRYTGETCPLCALDVRGLIECTIQYMNFSKGDKGWRGDLAEAVKKAQAALSRPSEAPAPAPSPFSPSPVP